MSIPYGEPATGEIKRIHFQNLAPDELEVQVVPDDRGE
jgi:hypothetical protein